MSWCLQFMALRTGAEREGCSHLCFVSPAVSCSFRAAFPSTHYFELINLFACHRRFPYPIKGYGVGSSPKSGAGHSDHRVPGDALEEAVPGTVYLLLSAFAVLISWLAPRPSHGIGWRDGDYVREIRFACENLHLPGAVLHLESQHFNLHVDEKSTTPCTTVSIPHHTTGIPTQGHGAAGEGQSWQPAGGDRAANQRAKSSLGAPLRRTNESLPEGFLNAISHTHVGKQVQCLSGWVRLVH